MNDRKRNRSYHVPGQNPYVMPPPQAVANQQMQVHWQQMPPNGLVNQPPPQLQQPPMHNFSMNSMYRPNEMQLMEQQQLHQHQQIPYNSRIPSATRQQLESLHKAKDSAENEKKIAHTTYETARNQEQIALNYFEQAERQLQTARDKYNDSMAALSKINVMDCICSQGGRTDANSADEVYTHDMIRKMFRRRGRKKHPTLRKLCSDNRETKPAYLPSPVPVNQLRGCNHLLHSSIPDHFPENMLFRALSCYSTIRTFSLELLISPFPAFFFLRALRLQTPSKLINEIHVALLRVLYAELSGKNINNRKSKLIAPIAIENPTIPGLDQRDWNMLDNLTWPIYFCDYADMTSSQFEIDDYLENNVVDDAVSQSSASGTMSDIDQIEDDDSDGGSTDVFEISDEVAPEYKRSDGEFNNICSVKRAKLVDTIKPSTSDRQQPPINIFNPNSASFKKTQPLNTLRSQPKSSVAASGKSSVENISNFSEIVERKNLRTSQISKSVTSKKVLLSNKYDNSSLKKSSDEKPSTSDDKSFTFPHLALLNKLRTTHYHLLSVTEKLDIIEYLVDELLQTDFAVDELNKRFTNRSALWNGWGTHFGKSIPMFESGPRAVELESLINDDECAVCGEEGDLLCCDGCVRSFHRQCISLQQTEELPERWLCPECILPDSSRVGSLRGGSKPFMEWFTFMDLPPESRGRSTFSTMDSPVRAYLWKRQFMIVQGIVFTKLIGERACHTLMNQAQVCDLLKFLGPESCSKWPWSQIPHNPQIIFERQNIHDNDYVVSALSYYNTLLSPNFNNPCTYHNCYRNVSYRVNAISKRIDNEGTLRGDILSDVPPDLLSRITYHESDICNLQSVDLFDPVKEHILSLERKFGRSHLLFDCWRDDFSTGWSNRVKSAQTAKCLANLLAEMIGFVHCRAFMREWNRSPLDKRLISEDDEETRFSNLPALPNDWTIDEEIKERRWLKSVHPQKLYSTSRNFLIKRKGKIKQIELPHFNSTSTNDNSINISAVDIDKQAVLEGKILLSESKLIEDLSLLSQKATADAVSQERNDEIVREDDEVETRNRRRSGRTKSKTTHFVSASKVVSLTKVEKDRLEKSKRKQELKDLAADRHFEKQIHWKICGRKLFPPHGLLSPLTMSSVGRRGGIVSIPFMLYSDKLEVAQPTVGNMWRLHVKNVVTLPELAIQLHVLHQNINETIMSSCESAGRRTSVKSYHPKKKISGILRNELTGNIEYFLYNSNKHKGYWVSEENLDTTSFVFKQISRKKTRNNRKSGDTVEIAQSKALQLAQNYVKSAQSALNHCKQALDMRKKATVNAWATLKAAEKRLLDIAREIEYVNCHQPLNSRSSDVRNQRMAQAYTQQMKYIFTEHQQGIFNIYMTSFHSRRQPSSEAINALRVQTRSKLQSMTQKLLGRTHFVQDSVMTEKLTNAERLGLEQFRTQVIRNSNSTGTFSANHHTSSTDDDVFINTSQNIMMQGNQSSNNQKQSSGIERYLNDQGQRQHHAFSYSGREQSPAGFPVIENGSGSVQTINNNSCIRNQFNHHIDYSDQFG